MVINRDLYFKKLIASKVKEDHIIKIALDDQINKKYKDSDMVCESFCRTIKPLVFTFF